ncbi:MAG: ferritin family protein, partial [Nanoarchaeota archaeon]
LLSNLSPTSDTSNLLISIKEAIDRERNSYLMYKELYDGTNNGIVKELFFYLSEEELRHMEKLKSIYKII